MPLPRPGAIDKPATGENQAPRNAAEAVLASIWRELLQHEQVDIDDNYFALGGDSISAIQLVSRLRKDVPRIGVALQAYLRRTNDDKRKAVAGMLDHWERALVDIGFLDPAAPKKLMPRLNQLFNRSALTPEEIHILRGVAKAMSQAAARPKL